MTAMTTPLSGRPSRRGSRALRPARSPGHVRRLLTFPERALHRFEDLPDRLAPGDLLVVNDAATIPASLHGFSPAGLPLELRLSGQNLDGTWSAVALGAGDWRTDTDLRPAPPALSVGDQVRFVAPGPAGAGTLRAVIVQLADDRRPVLRFSAPEAELWSLLYRFGRPVQYRHLAVALDVWDVQLRFAGPPLAVEPPSGGLGLTLGLLGRLRARGVQVCAISEAAGLSATGDPTLDASLPFPERYIVPASTWAAVSDTRARGGRVVAVGTSVVRALESVARTGRLDGVTALKLAALNPVQVVDGLLSGVHAPGTSHYALLDAVLVGNGLPPWADLGESAAALDLHDHEFGDAVLILRPAASPQGAARLTPRAA